MSWLDAETARVFLVTTGTVTVALSSYGAAVATRGRAHAKAARVQVENSHVDAEGNQINLREEADERHDEIMDSIRDLKSAVFAELRTIRVDLSREAQRIQDLEHTQERERRE